VSLNNEVLYSDTFSCLVDMVQMLELAMSSGTTPSGFHLIKKDTIALLLCLVNMDDGFTECPPNKLLGSKIY
jgi:hypothetical protein